MPQYKKIFSLGYDVDSIKKNISLLNPDFDFIDNNTLLFFDEIQEYPDAATSLKSFSLDGRYDVIVSGGLLGVHYKKISSIPVGYKEDYTMYSMDFEEFLWAHGYKDDFIDEIYQTMLSLKPLSDIYFKKLESLFNDFIFVGGYPEAVYAFVNDKTFSRAFRVQARLSRDYEDDISKYVEGLETTKVVRFYHHISSQLAKDNHKFQISKLNHGAKSRDYIGVEEWLKDAGIINVSTNLSELTKPLSAYENQDHYRIYFADYSLFIATLDEEAKDDLIMNQNYAIYNGALYESVVSSELVKSGYKLYFYKAQDATTELDFVIRVKMILFLLK